MPTWLIIVLIAHVFNAGAFLVDKFLLSNVIKSSIAYAFVVGVLSVFAIVLIPFGVAIPAVSMILLNILVGALFVVALLLFFESLKRGEVSRVATYIGGSIPLWIMILSYQALGERLTGNELMSVGLLVIGAVLIVYEPVKVGKKQQKWFWIATGSALAFAISQTLRRYIFLHEEFLTGFFWQALGTVSVAVLLYLIPKSRKDIFQIFPVLKTAKGALFLFGQALGAFGFILLSYAVSLKSATIVQSLQGVQYALLIILALIASVINPKMLKEQFTPRSLAQKLFATTLISIALIALAKFSG